MGRKAIEVTKKNLSEVMTKFGYYLEENPLGEGPISMELESLIKEMDSTLDSLMQYDYFGTEGQSDPRGDWRD